MKQPIRPQSPYSTMPVYVGTAQVAKALGVGVSTVKRWVDDKILPAQLTVGGHRKLFLKDVLRLVREGVLPQADLSLLLNRTGSGKTPDPAQLARQISAAITKGDSEEIRALLQGAYKTGLAIETIADQLIAPAMKLIGRRWETGKTEVLLEHRITQAIVAAMYEMKSRLRLSARRDRPLAIGGAPEGDIYLLPTLLAQMTLLDCGWEAVNLGPHTPFSALRRSLDELKPRLVWISASHIADPEAFIEEFNDFFRSAASRGVSVVVGGRATTEPIRVRLAYTSYGDGMTQLAAFARSQLPQPKRPRGSRV